MYRFPSELLKRLFWTAACSTYPMAFDRAMKQLAKSSKAGHEQLSKLDGNCWSKAFFSCTPKADNVENNMSECFNAWIITER